MILGVRSLEPAPPGGSHLDLSGRRGQTSARAVVIRRLTWPGIRRGALTPPPLQVSTAGWALSWDVSWSTRVWPPPHGSLGVLELLTAPNAGRVTFPDPALEVTRCPMLVVTKETPRPLSFKEMGGPHLLVGERRDHTAQGHGGREGFLVAVSGKCNPSPSKHSAFPPLPSNP